MPEVVLSCSTLLTRSFLKKAPQKAQFLLEAPTSLLRTILCECLIALESGLVHLPGQSGAFLGYLPLLLKLFLGSW